MVDSFFDTLPEYIELIMGYAPALFIVVVPLAVFIAYRKTKRETGQAQKTARLLGLTYINVAEEMKAGKPGDSTFLDLLSGWSPWAMEGTYKKVPVRVELVVKSKQQRYIAPSDQAGVSNPTRASYSRGTVYTVSFEKPLPFDVNIHQKPEMPFGMSKMLSPNSIEIGDAELDGKLSVSGSDPDAIKQWLGSGQRKDALKKLYQTLPGVLLNNQGLQLRDPLTRADAKHLTNNLTLLSGAIRKFRVN